MSVRTLVAGGAMTLDKSVANGSMGIETELVFPYVEVDEGERES